MGSRISLQLFAQSDRLRVLSLNAEWFPGRTPQAARAQQGRHIAALHRLLHEVNPDVWLIQEVNCTNALSRVLTLMPDMTLHTASAFKDSPHQLAIAARLPFILAETARWTAVDNESPPPRGVAGSVLKFNDGSILPVLTLHLKSNYRGGEDYDVGRNIKMREDAISQFVDYVQRITQQTGDRILRGILLGGDLNTLYPAVLFREEKTASILKDAGFSFLGAAGLDHFWGIGISNALFQVIDGHDVSDHPPIVLEIPMPDVISIQRQPPRFPEEVASLAGNLKTDLNSAQLSELMSLPGIGPVLAGRILLRRPFSSVEELVEVCGIGPITLEQMLPYIDVLNDRRLKETRDE